MCCLLAFQSSPSPPPPPPPAPPPGQAHSAKHVVHGWLLCRKGQAACIACQHSTLQEPCQTCRLTAPFLPSSLSLCTSWEGSGMGKGKPPSAACSFLHLRSRLTTEILAIGHVAPAWHAWSDSPPTPALTNTNPAPPTLPPPPLPAFPLQSMPCYAGGTVWVIVSASLKY